MSWGVLREDEEGERLPGELKGTPVSNRGEDEMEDNELEDDD
jgi:hypothetical protein